jgi:tRNA G18 (ribose-2'-O)-methylase SpoU
MPRQLNHHETFFQKRKFPLVLVCDGITFQPNIGSLFRIAEAFGVEKIIFIGEVALTPRKINRTSRNTHLMVEHLVIKNHEEAISYFSGGNYEIIALEITENSTPLPKINVPSNKPVALIAGSEVSGIHNALLKQADQIAHIEMFGNNSSMNVVQAVGIALYDITSKMQ